jgi:hypothetical protein
MGRERLNDGSCPQCGRWLPDVEDRIEILEHASGWAVVAWMVEQRRIITKLQMKIRSLRMANGDWAAAHGRMLEQVRGLRSIVDRAPDETTHDEADDGE